MPSPKGIRKAGQDIYSVNFADYLPGALKHDTKMRAIAEAVTKEALKVSGEIENVLIYSQIDELPEPLIDILAYDMHVDWYNYHYTLEAKKNIIKDSVKVHKKMGTKYAIEKALRALYPKSVVQEWFQYGGLPFMFRVVIDISESMESLDISEIVRVINIYKRLAAHLEGILYKFTTNMNVKVITVNKIGERIHIKPIEG